MISLLQDMEDCCAKMRRYWKGGASENRTLLYVNSNNMAAMMDDIKGKISNIMQTSEAQSVSRTAEDKTEAATRRQRVRRSRAGGMMAQDPVRHPEVAGGNPFRARRHKNRHGWTFDERV